MRSPLLQMSRQLLHATTTGTAEVEIEARDGDVLVISFVLLSIGVFLGYCYVTYGFFHKIERYFPAASTNMIMGFFVGLILWETNTLNNAFSFDPEFFFVYLLPPIIFSAGYNLPKDFFFHNFGSIMTFAFVGTTLSAFLIGGCLTGLGRIGLIEELSFTKNMLMGSLISAVDPVAVILVLKSLSVDEQLKVLLFGESVLNDAASVVINRVFTEIDVGGKSASEALAPAIPQIVGIAIASMLIGTVIALFVSMLHKFSKMHSKTDCAEIELAAFLLGAFLPYGIAEALGLSGICAVLFGGVMTDYYTFWQLSEQSQETTRHTVKTLSYLSELFVFIYLGMSFFLETAHEFRAGFVIATLALCFVARAVSVFPLAFLLNMGRKHKLPLKHQVVLWYSGLRGPVAYALSVAGTASGGEASRIIVTATIFIVAFTTLLLGGMAYPFLKWLQPPEMRSTTKTKTDTYDISNHWFNRLDRRFLRPYFGPKSRRNVKRPMNSMGDVELDVVAEKGADGMRPESQDVSLIGPAVESKPQFELIAPAEYIQTNTNEKDAEETSDADPKGVHLELHRKDYSSARTGGSLFIDNPAERREISEDQSKTWSEPAANHLGPVLSVQPPSLNKAVTPPPDEVPVENAEEEQQEPHDLMSSIQKE